MTSVNTKRVSYLTYSYKMLKGHLKIQSKEYSGKYVKQRTIFILNLLMSLKQMASG